MVAIITHKDPDCREAEKSRQRLCCVPYELFNNNVDISLHATIHSFQRNVHTYLTSSDGTYYSAVKQLSLS